MNKNFFFSNFELKIVSNAFEINLVRANSLNQERLTLIKMNIKPIFV